MGLRANAQRIMREDINAREYDEIRLQARARKARTAAIFGLEVVEVPGDGNCFLIAARFALLQLHGWNYDLAPSQESMRAEVCMFMRGKSLMLDTRTVVLEELRVVEQDPRPRSAEYNPPRLDFYDSWDEWVEEMERPKAFTDILLAHGLSYFYGVTIRLIVD